MNAVLASFRYLFAAFVVLAVYLMSVQQPLDHDEHQFVASAALIARDGLVPYRDFPYFHLPYLSYLYALPFQFSDRLLLTARLVSASAAIAIVFVVWRQARKAFATLPDWPRTVLCAGFALALLTSPLFMYTAGRSWNHDMSILFALLAALRVASAATAKTPATAMFAGGVFLGVAVGIRSTMVAAIPFLYAASFFVNRRAEDRHGLAAAAWFTAGIAVALLPLLAFMALSPEAFVYGNVFYNLKLNPLYRASMGFDVAMTWTQKSSYALYEILDHPRTAALCLAYIGSGAIALRGGTRDGAWRTAATIAICLPALVAAALAPTPSWYQYYYALQVFVLAGTLANLATLGDRNMIAALLVCAPMLAGALTGMKYLWPLDRPAPVAQWTVSKTAAVGRRITEIAGSGRVLTLGPIFALEGDAEIYPALATGPFQWRTARFVPRERHSAFGLVGPADVRKLRDDPALRAVLTGVETNPDENLEAELLAFVSNGEWVRHDFDDGLTLWSRRPAMPPAR